MERIVLRGEVLYVEFKIEAMDNSRQALDRLRSMFTDDIKSGHINFWLDISAVEYPSSVFVGTLAFMIKGVEDIGRVVVEGATDVFKRTVREASKELFNITSILFIERKDAHV